MEEAKKKDDQINDEKRRQFRQSKKQDGRRNTTTYDDKDEEARNQMVKMRVDWSPEEDSLVRLKKKYLFPMARKKKRVGIQWVGRNCYFWKKCIHGSVI